jgi:dihydroxy-acid dehydratase
VPVSSPAAAGARPQARSIIVDLTAADIAQRPAAVQVNTGIARGGLLGKYALPVRPGHQGALTRSSAVVCLHDET